MVTYTDADGVQRYGVEGEVVDVHPDHLKRFDGINGTAVEDKPAPKKQAPRKG